MSKDRKHLIPVEWEEEDSGEVRHPHREVKIVGEKKIGQEPIDQQPSGINETKKKIAKK